MSGEAGLILSIALMSVLAITVVGIFLGKQASTTLDGWLVNSRLMGPILVWFLLGTEIYTVFTFLGLAGFAYTKGAPAFYNVALNDVAYAIGFFVLPAIWLIGKKFSYVTQSDFIAGRYRSQHLGIFVALTSALIMIAYVDLNIEGLGAIVHVVTGGHFSTPVSDVIGFLALALAVLFGGIRGNAWQSVIKDILMFVAIAVLFFVVPEKYFGGFGPMFSQMVSKIPSHLDFPGTTKNLGLSWFVTTVILNGLGQWMWPQWFGVAFTARGPRTLKLQAVFMPFYQLVKVAVITMGFAAFIILGFNTHINGNNVVMMLAMRSFPAWFLAVFVVAAVFSAIVPAGPIIMVSSSLLARNVYQKLVPATSEQTVYRLTKGLIIPVTLVALFLALVAPALIVTVLLVAYDFISQLFPAVIIGGLFWRRATKEGVLSGLLVGWAAAAYLLVTKHDPFLGMNAGLVALVMNLMVFFVVSLLTRSVDKPYLDDFFAAIRHRIRRSPDVPVPVPREAGGL